MDWIKTREKKPLIGQRCLIARDDILHPYIVEAATYVPDRFTLYGGDYYIEAEGVDYWMPAPPIPKPLTIYKIERRQW